MIESLIMPELPEVEVVVESLRSFLRGRRIVDVEVRREKSFPQDLNWAKNIVIEREIIDVARRAKFIQIKLGSDWQILTHLKMTGQLIYVGAKKHETAGGGHPTADWTKQLPGNHTRIIWTLDNGGKLYFNDQRVFGWMKLLKNNEVEEQYFAKLGPDANTAEFTAEYLVKKLERKRVPIKMAIMDNAIVCGLGNIYAAETCFAVELDPRKPANEVSFKKLKELVKVSKEILAAAIRVGGTTFDGKYVDAEGKSGNYSEKLNVYGRAGEECVRCGGILENVKLGGRATVFCPHCQS